MDRWLFETPWWLLSVVAVAAVGLLVAGNNRQKSNLKAAGVSVLALAGALWATSYFVDTPRETCVRQTREWVTAVVAKDSAKLGALLHPKVALAAWNRDDILAGAVKCADIYGLQSAFVTNIEGKPDPSNISVTVSVISRHDAKMAVLNTIPSTWELGWVKADDGRSWVIKDIFPIRIGQAERSQFRDDLFGHSPR